MAEDDATDFVLCATVLFEIFGTEFTDSDKDVKELCSVIRRRLQRPRRYWVYPLIIVDVKYGQCVHNGYI